MSGTTVGGFTNRQTIYNSFRNQEPDFFTQEHIDLFTENGTKDFPLLHWYMVWLNEGETDHWILAQNRSNPSNLLKVHVFYPGPMTTLQGNFHVASGTAGVNFSKTDGKMTYFVAVEVPDETTLYTFDDGDGTVTSASTVATPVFAPRTDGKIEITCATTDAEILFRESGDSKWKAYDEYYPNFNMTPGRVFYAVAGKLGERSSGQTSYVVGYKLAKPTITVNEYPGAKVLVLESPEESIVHGLTLKHKINGVETTSTLVETGDVVVAWATKAGGSFTNSDTETVSVS